MSFSYPKLFVRGVLILVFIIILFEIYLQVKNPFQNRIEGNRIVLPKNVVYEFENKLQGDLDSLIVHKKNNWGLRGKIWQGNEQFKFLFVGGSTTECFYLNEGQDWPNKTIAILQNRCQKVSIAGNNAGLDGHSTFGHKILLEDHLLALKPTHIVFLIGCNDIALQGLNKFDLQQMSTKKRWYQKIKIFQLYMNLRRKRNAKKMGLGHQFVDFKKVNLSDTSGWRKHTIADSFVAQYKQRVSKLIQLCLSKKIQPIFLTQTSLLGYAIDRHTGQFIGSWEYQGKSALHYWNVLNAYNAALIEVCMREKVRCFDVSTLLEKRTEYFYDYFHFNRTGSDKMANLMADLLEKFTINGN